MKTSEQKDSDEDEPDWDEVYKSNLPDQDEDDTEAPKAPEPDSEEDIEEDIDPLLKSICCVIIVLNTLIRGFR